MSDIDPSEFFGAPIFPPVEWFSIPEDYDPVKNSDPLIRIYDSGRVAALVAPLDSCIQDGNARPGRCFRPPDNDHNFEYAHIGRTQVEDGSIISSANIGMGLDHADGFMSASAASSHYANTSFQRMRVRYVKDKKKKGIFAVGSLTPDASLWDSIVLKASALSGDWRWVEEGNGLFLIASMVVSVPGFRPYISSSPSLVSCASNFVNGDNSVLLSGWSRVAELIVDEIVAIANSRGISL